MPCFSSAARPSRPRRRARRCRRASPPCPARPTPQGSARRISRRRAHRASSPAPASAPSAASWARRAVKAGAVAGKAAGKKVKPLKFRVGYLDIIGGIESADRAHNSLRVALTRLGATWSYCDGQGTPTKWVTCCNSLLAQDIDVLALTGIDPSTIPAVVASSAKEKNIPIVDFGGTVGPGFNAQFAPDEAKNGDLAGD